MECFNLKVGNINNVVVLTANDPVSLCSTWRDVDDISYVKIDYPDGRKPVNGFIGLLCRFIMSRRINYYVSLPFKEHWMSRLMPEDAYPPDVKLVIVEEGCSFMLYRECIEYMRRRWPGVMIVFRLLNPMSAFLGPSISEKEFRRQGEQLISSLSKIYDRVYAWDKKDAVKYGWSYIGPVVSLEGLPGKQYPESDLFFVGLNKGRLSKVYRILDWAHSNGFTTDFHVIGVPENEQRRCAGIEYNRFLSYREVLARMISTRCIVELVPPGQRYLTLRPFEAVAFGKKLLTDNPEVKGMPYYDPRQMFVEEKLNTIDRRFLDDSYLANYGGDWSPVNFINHVFSDLGL